MRKIILAPALAALVAVPLLAMQPTQSTTQKAKQSGLPHTVARELLLFQDINYNGARWVVESPSSVVRTDWNIRSVAMHPGDRWQICARSRFRDPCIILDRSVHDATLIGVEGQIGSARLAPPAAATQQN